MTRKITPAQLDEIEATAKRATPGPWRWTKPGIDYYEVLNDHTAVAVDMVKQADAKLIAMMDPATTLALVAEVRELRERWFDVASVAYAVDGSAGGAVEYCHPDTGEWRDVARDLLKALGEEA